MKNYKLIYVILLNLFTHLTYGHQDFYVFNSHGNIETRFKTGYEYEEIRKADVIGKLAEKLAEELNYKAPIFLDFSHFYIRECDDAGHFISYDNGRIESSVEGMSVKYSKRKKNYLVIRQVDHLFSATATLKLLEYAILNISSVKTEQKLVEYNKNHSWWRINSIDTGLITKILSLPNSKLLNSILSLKIERAEDDFNFGISYYIQNEKFNIFIRGFNDSDTTIFTINNIYQYKKFGKSEAIVFDTDTSFYFIRQFKGPDISNGHSVSNRHAFDNTMEISYRTFKIAEIGGGKISIYSDCSPCISLKDGVLSHGKTFIYLIDKDIFVQNLDELLEIK